MEIGPIAVDLIFGLIAIFFLTFDIRKRGLGLKYFYIWTFSLVLAYLFFENLFAISLVILVYVVWSRLLYPTEEAPNEV